MGAFNTVKAVACCPFCGNRQNWSIQFKYGDCWQCEYKIGDKLRWGGNDKGSKVGGAARTDGIAEENCKKCGQDSVEAAVYFSGNVITSVELLKAPLNLEEYFEKLDG